MTSNLLSVINEVLLYYQNLREHTVSEDKQPKSNKGSNFYEVLLMNMYEAANLMDTDLKVLLWNPAAEKLTGYKQSEVLGKPCQKNFLIHDGKKLINLCDELCPIRQTIKDGLIRNVEVFLSHKKGHRIPVLMRVIPIRNSGGMIIGAVETYHETSPKVAMPASSTYLKKMDMLDSLTEMGNQRYLDIHLHSRLEEWKQHKVPLGLLYIDVDNLTHINDSYGERVGDDILKTIANTLANNIRFYEFIGRWEEDKFLVVLVNADNTKLDLIANKLRLLIEQSNVRVRDTLLRTTVSMGVTLARPRDTVETLVSRAEKLCDQSKLLGKNMVSIRFKDE